MSLFPALPRLYAIDSQQNLWIDQASRELSDPHFHVAPLSKHERQTLVSYVLGTIKIYILKYKRLQVVFLFFRRMYIHFEGEDGSTAKKGAFWKFPVSLGVVFLFRWIVLQISLLILDTEIDKEDRWDSMALNSRMQKNSQCLHYFWPWIPMLDQRVNIL